MRPLFLRTAAAAVSLAFLGVQTASAADILSIKTFRLHDFDAAILDTRGYADGAVNYFRELGTISDAEMKERNTYEPIRCYPFYVMKEGKIDNTGYNCRTFFCVGYKPGPAVCKDREGKAYGGVVEINNRLSLMTVKLERKSFASFPARLRTPLMEQAIADLEPVKCVPFYMMEFDVAVGEGYQCEEVGEFPDYSAKNICENDWRGTEGMKCAVAIREDEMARRRSALGLPPVSSSAPTQASSQAVSSSDVSSAAPAIPLKTFPDVLEGKYGYTAIVSLATLGVIKGYPDGTYRPTQVINRAEFARLFMQGLYADELRDEGDCFKDVSAQWYAPAACAAKRLGWIKGYQDGTFSGARTISKAEGLKIVMASLTDSMATDAPLPPGINPDEWFAPYVRKAVELKILLEPTLDAQSPATRADAAVWMYRAARYRAAQVAASAAAAVSSAQAQSVSSASSSSVSVDPAASSSEASSASSASASPQSSSSASAQ